jgi:acetyltransferase EpsM|tara:strand:- start:1001 stop:1675 length:675 start_codon:yes stop_codon:yes gene_type:complete
MNDKKKILFWGGKSKAKILNNMLNRQGEELSYIYDKFINKLDFDTNAEFSNDKNNLLKIISSSSHFVVCLGSGEYGKGRYLISMELIKRGLKPLPVISEHSIIDSTAEVGWGLQAMPGSLLHSYSKLGNACILNSNSTIDHDCIVGNGVHIMGSAAIAGRVEIGDYVSIGTNATVLPDIKIGDGAYVGAGAVVNKDVKKNTIVIGSPAKVLKEIKHEYDLSDFE